MKIACFSVAAIDYFPACGQYFAGGNALNQAINLAKLGYATSFFGAVGTDAEGDHILALLQKAGVDDRHCVRLHGATASNQIVNDEAGERFGVDGAWKNGVYGDYRFEEST
jgi:fructoselysine 6-kinase